MPPRSGANAESRRLTEFLLADIIGIAADAIICTDAEQRITLFNDGAAQIFGWTAEEAIGQPLEILLPERIREIHRVHMERFAKSPDRARKMGQRQEISGLRKNGEEFPAEAAIAKVTMGDTAVFSVVLRDITEQVELHKRLQRAVRARDDTVGVVAHDLRNPVSAVKMLSQVLLTGDGEEALRSEAKEAVALIRDAAIQMDRLIEDLLDITRVEEGRLSVDLQPVTTVALLEGALRTLRPLVEDAGHTLAIDLPSTLPTVNADPERIGQVLSNLVGNSIKFTPSGGRIRVVATHDGDVVRVSVADTGMGISAEHLPFVFDRFWQNQHSTIRSRGAGLGLPIARGIITAHGGQMSAESIDGKGSTFSFTIPVARE
ncbi:MAG TPA: PAS domain-containing sensor histidine kinase [Gemmatimonadaceae bacterium]|nr:PAS domain-containing sensor histidine kinase [Gemmatimonadaceae bacterium]